MSRRSMDPQKYEVYAAEEHAFAGTPLADLQREQSIVAAYESVLVDPWWIYGAVEIRNARADMTTAGGKATAEWVQTSAGRTHRYTVSHELAHVLHRRVFRADGDAGHGERFRRAHVITVDSIFGGQYADLLTEAYHRHGLAIAPHPPAVKLARTPIINIDALSIAVAPTGGWNRRAS